MGEKNDKQLLPFFSEVNEFIKITNINIVWDFKCRPGVDYN